MKHRAVPRDTTAELVTVRQIIDWDVPADALRDATQQPGAPIVPRESRSFELDAEIRLAKLEENDCDIHLEVAAPGSDGSERVIVEIPGDSDMTETRRRVVELLRPHGELGAAPLVPAVPVRVRLRGYAFLDCAPTHWIAGSKKGRERGSDAVQTMWKLHPVWWIGR
jgi:hypothetical protein